jgi:RNA polymerase sigma-70 factor (ECF subfamily)
MDMERLLETWRGPLVGLLAAWGASPSEARELAQDVFAQAWLARGRFDGDPLDERRVGAWLRGIARNLYLAAQRERARGAGAEHADGAAASPAGEADERLAALRAALDALEPELREALYVRYVDGTPLAAVAALLGIGERAAEGRLYRGRQLLKERIERSVSQREVRR